MEGFLRKLGLAAAATLSVAAAPTADAATNPATQWPADGPAMQQARTIADAHWGMVPCNGDVKIAWAKLPSDENAGSTWVNPFQDYFDAKDNAQCSVAFNVTQDWNWAKLCTVFVHEFGHLAGNPHSDDPKDVMFPFYDGTNVPACAAVSPAAYRAPTAPRQGRRTPAAKRASRSRAYRADTTPRPRRPGSQTRQR